MYQHQILWVLDITLGFGIWEIWVLGEFWYWYIPIRGFNSWKHAFSTNQGFARHKVSKCHVQA
jgi:hypothetical protein